MNNINAIKLFQEIEEEEHLKEQMESSRLSSVKSKETEVNELLRKIKEKESFALKQNEQSVCICIVILIILNLQTLLY